MEASALRAPAGLARLSLPSALLKLRSDEQLVALFRAGNDEAFRVIHDRYRQRLFAYVRQMLSGSRSDAEDAMQDVFLRAYNALRVDDRPVALKAWLYRVAHNRCIDQLRRPVPAPADVFEMSRPLMPDPLAETERRDDLRRLVADVQRLPEQQRSALLMRELEGLSYADLANALDVSVPAVKSLLVRARIGLVEAAEARDVACSEIRGDLALSFGKGVRASAKARRHMRECGGCRDYRTQLRGVKSELAALLPGPGPFAVLAKTLGLGSAASSGGAAVVGGGAAAGFTAKVAALVCCAAVVGGGAVELRARTGGPTGIVQRDAQPAALKRDKAAADRITAPAPAVPADVAPTLRLRTETARPKAATKSVGRRLRRAAITPAAATAAHRSATQDDGAISHVRPSSASTATTTEPSTGGSAGPAEEEPATTSGQSSSSTGTTGSPTATGASTATGAVDAPTGTTTDGSSPTATAASTSGTSGGDSGSSSDPDGTTTTAAPSGSRRR